MHTTQKEYRHKWHGNIYRVEGRGNVAASTLARESRDAAQLATNQALVGKVIAGREWGGAMRYWVGTVRKAYKNLTLEVVTRAGNVLKVKGGEEITFEAWDAASNDPENNTNPTEILP